MYCLSLLSFLCSQCITLMLIVIININIMQHVGGYRIACLKRIIRIDNVCKCSHTYTFLMTKGSHPQVPHFPTSPKWVDLKQS